MTPLCLGVSEVSCAIPFRLFPCVLFAAQNSLFAKHKSAVFIFQKSKMKLG